MSETGWGQIYLPTKILSGDNLQQKRQSLYTSQGTPHATFESSNENSK